MGKTDKDPQAIAAEGPAPPPYSEAVQGSNSQAGPSDGAAEASTASTKSAYRPFPRVTNAYYQWKVSLTFHLGEPADQRLYAVSTHTGWGKNSAPGLVLHNGATNKDPMLATAGEEAGWNDSTPTSVITLPPLPGSPGARCTEIMRSVVSGNTVHFRFSTEVMHEGGLVREDFVWRICKGKEVKELGDGPWEGGFKLTRVGGRAGGSGGEGRKGIPGGSGEEEEVLAVFAWNRIWNFMNPFRVQFEGSGRRGEMGERWELMVIITGLRLWWLKRQFRVSPSVVAPGAADMVPGSKG